MAFTSSQARTAAHRRWSQTVDRTEATRPGREAALAKLEREVDPGGVMSPANRAKAAENLRIMMLLQMSVKGVAARQATKKKAAQRRDGA